MTDNSGTWSVIEMITHKTAAATMIAVRRARSGVGANSRLNQAREPNGKNSRFRCACADRAHVIRATFASRIATGMGR